ncbi:hypothetical protein EDC04DRAFT_2601466 [Pisolithus marmoratus]|nr:hypothetical protein EDC04DRAFT_2601466 [Pisolithus marmoratus]
MDPSQVDGTTFPQASASPKSKLEAAPPMPTDYPSIRFWDREDWDKYLESPEGQTSKRGTMGYLEDKDGNPPSRETAKAIRKLLRRGWVELVHWELAPPSWGRLSASARQFIHGLMETTYPHFKFTNNVIHTQPGGREIWTDSGRWKQKRGKDLKMEEDDDNDDDDDSSDEIGRKRKAGAIKSEESAPEKRFKGKHEVEDGNTPSTSAASLSPPASDDSEVVSPHPDPVCASAERDTNQYGGNNITPIDPLAALALAASKARDILPLPLPDTSQELQSSSTSSDKAATNTQPILELEHAVLPAATPMPSTIPATVDNAPGSVAGKGRMRPGPAKNGRNLCAYRWRKQVPSNGMTEEFQKYYLSLTSAQQQAVQAYDAEATALAASNNWDTKTICNGTLH